MIQTYNGRVEDGHFYSIDGAMVPDCQAAVLVVEKASRDICERQAEAMRRFREELRQCDDEPITEFERIRLRETFL